MKFVPVILSGGAGSRLWPLSRSSHPKPFMRLPDGKSLLQHAFMRAASLERVSEILTVTNSEMQFETIDNYRHVNLAGIETPLVLEPFGRDTAAAIVSAALYAETVYGDDTILFILPADHIVSDVAAFQSAAQSAVILAEQGRIVTLGINPSHAETAYGYIEADGENVIRFVEKPGAEKAQEYLDSARFHWNAGMLCFRVNEFLTRMETYSPDIARGCRATMSASTPLRSNAVTGVVLDAGTFAKVPSLSIDYALLEKSPDIAMVGCDMGWNDVGSWNAIAELTEANQDGNRTLGEAVLVDSRNCYIHAEKRLVGAVGLDNVLVVETADAILVADRNSLQDVRTLFEQLKAIDHETHNFHQTVHRPWGTYTVLENGDRFKIKRIEVNPGARLSLQMHHHRSEHWVVVSGQAKVTVGENELILDTNQSTYIECGQKHRLENSTTEPLAIIEVQCGDYLGEDDIVRFDDIYGRLER